MTRTDYIYRYRMSTEKHINERYKTPSARKKAIWDNCLAIMLRENGFQPKVISHNCHFFSMAFLTYDECGNEILYVITPSKHIIIRTGE